MKTLFLSLALTATALLPFSQPAFAQKGDDVAQIKAVVERETDLDGQKQYTHETRYLETMGGQWKIVHVGAAFYTPAK